MEDIFKNFLDAISPALQTAIIALVTLLLGQINFFLKEQWQLVKLKASTEQQKILDFVVFNAVQTVGQLYEGFDNSYKKGASVALAQSRLKDFGITVDLNVIENAIEAAVFGGANISGVTIQETVTVQETAKG